MGRLDNVDNGEKWHEDPLITSGLGAGFFFVLIITALSVWWWCRKRDASSSSGVPKAHLATSSEAAQPLDGVLRMSALTRKDQSQNSESFLDPVVFDGSYAVPTQPDDYLQHEYRIIGENIDGSYTVPTSPDEYSQHEYRIIGENIWQQEVDAGFFAYGIRPFNMLFQPLLLRVPNPHGIWELAMLHH